MYPDELVPDYAMDQILGKVAQNGSSILTSAKAWSITAFERLFRDRGLPLAIRSDNGVPFASPNALFNLSKPRFGGSGSGLRSNASSWAIPNGTAGTSACT